ncbi:putative beta-glucosidase [Rhizodiscina lignyota]|uniref:beta-glucosidase n=1 Tax=Rhizodiscina lignyota TaxID=1504668 RepID=A0A9P4IHY8_9PEZI|nr:putative beta-glucosidase [Rhizodiscina lignyota]
MKSYIFVFCLLLSLTTGQNASGESFHIPINPGRGNWTAAYAKAREFVCQLTLTEKINFTTSTGAGSTTGYDIGIVPRLGFRGFARSDGPVGVRGTDYNNAFPAGLNVAATWDRELMYTQGHAIGMEQKGKGFNMALAPVVSPMGRNPTGGRNFEAYSPDPYLSAAAFSLAVAGMQDAGAIAVGKHFLLYEQERFRYPGNDYGIPDPDNVTMPYSANCDDRTLHELYLLPWYDAVRSGLAGVMCSYNQLNNSQACQNTRLLNDILKGQLGFPGLVLSDYGSQYSGVLSALSGLDQATPGDALHYSPNPEPGISYWGPNLTISVLNGSVPEWRIDDMVTRVMAAYYFLGQDHNYPELNAGGGFQTYGYMYPSAMLDYTQINFHVDVRDHHAGIIRKVGADSVILLKNVHATLPLKPEKIKQIGIIGQDAGPSAQGPNGYADRAGDSGTLAMGWGSGTANFPYLVDPLAAIQARALRDQTVVQYVLNNSAADAIDAIAEQASACLVFANADSGESYVSVAGVYGDRNNLTLWGDGDALIKEVAANCSNTIVVIHATGPVLMEEWIDHPNVTAVLFAGLPGQESGSSLVDVLYGDVNPSGKLPWTIAKNEKDYGTPIIPYPSGPTPQVNFTEGLFIDYRHFDKDGIAPRFEFGFGMSYTSFKYSNLVISGPSNSYSVGRPSPTRTVNGSVCASRKLNPSDYTFPATVSSITHYIYPYIASNATISTPGVPTATASIVAVQPPAPPGGDSSLYDILYTVSVDVTNNGSVAGQEVAQLYLDLGNGEPPRQLRGFNKMMIQPGETKTMVFELKRRDLSIWDVVSQAWVDVTSIGTTVGVHVGPSSRNLPLEGKIPGM